MHETVLTQGDDVDEAIHELVMQARAAAFDDAAVKVMDGHKGDGHCSACDMMSLKAADLRGLAALTRDGISSLHR